MGNVGSEIKNGASSAYHEVGNTVDSIGHAIGTVAQHGENIVDNVIQAGGNIVTHTEDSVTGVIKGAEWTIMLPLAALGIGLAIMLGRSNSSTLENVGTAAIGRI